MGVITGQRKFVIGMTYLVLSFAAFMWAPAITENVRLNIIQSDVVALGIIIGGNVAEHFSKSRQNKESGQ